MQFLKCTLAVLVAAPIFGSAGNPDAGLTVHEWGTFTTVANAAGGASAVVAAGRHIGPAVLRRAPQRDSVQDRHAG